MRKRRDPERKARHSLPGAASWKRSALRIWPEGSRWAGWGVGWELWGEAGRLVTA